MRKKLKDVCMFYSGTGFPIQYQGQTKGEYPFYKVGDIANNAIAGKIYLELCNNYISSDVAKMIKGCILPKDTVVFAKIGEALKLNRRAITSCDCLIDNNAMGIAPKLDSLRIQYFYFCMKNLKMQTLAESTTVPSVRKTVLEKYEIEVPSLVEQEEIEKKLTLTQKIIEKRRQELSYLDEIIKARFVEMFSDCTNMISLSDLCLIITDGTHQSPKFQHEGIPFILVSNLSKNTVTYDTDKFISAETYKELYKRTPIEIGDILLSTVGSYGHPAVVVEDRKFLFQRHIAYLKPKSDILNSYYMHGALLSPGCQRQIEEKVKGIAQKTLNLSEIRKIRIPVPSLDLQKQYADFVHQVNKSKVAVQKALDETQILFDSLMQKYFG